LRLAAGEIGEFRRHGIELYGVINAFGAPHSRTSLERRIAQLTALCAAHGVSAAAELVPVQDRFDMATALAARLPRPGQERLWASFASVDAALASATVLDTKLTAVGRYLLVEAGKISARLGASVQRHGGIAQVIRGDVLRIEVTFRRAGDPDDIDDDIDALQLTARLRPFLAPEDRVDLTGRGMVVSGAIVTASPAAALLTVVELARRCQLELEVDAQPRDHLVDALTRIAADVRSTRRRPAVVAEARAAAHP
jgi:hypothetical protein